MNLDKTSVSFWDVITIFLAVVILAASFVAHSQVPKNPCSDTQTMDKFKFQCFGYWRAK